MIPSRSISRGAGTRLALISLPVIAGSIASTSTSQAQEALRNAVQGDRSYQTRRQQAIESPMPMHAGPVGFSAGAGLRFTYDDNVLLRDADPREDFIIAPGADVGVYYPITDRTRLNFGIGIAYEIYTQGTRDDRFSLAPNSEVALDFEVDQALITTYDRFTYSQDLLEQGDVASNGQYGGFNNTLGVRVSWVPEPVLLEGGYSWNLFISDNAQYQDLDRNSHQVFFRVGQILAERTRWGVEATGSKTMYDSGVRNDFASYSAGPYLEWQVTQALNLSLRGGWTWTIFDDNGLLPPPDDVSVPYVGLEARHQLTSRFSHNLSANREVRVGTEAQYVDTLTFRYGFQWQVNDLITPSAGVFYEKGKEPAVSLDEEYDRFGLDFGLPFKLTDHLSLSLGYQHTLRDSNTAGRDYADNRATLDFRYQF